MRIMVWALPCAKYVSVKATQSPSDATGKRVSAGAGSQGAAPPSDKALSRLVLGLLRPYRGRLLIVFIAMLVEIAMSLAAPWPLKLVLDDALAHHKLPEWLAWAHNYGIGRPAGSSRP